MGEKQRLIKRLAHEQAGEILGPDLDHTRRVRSAEGIRFAFSDLQTPGSFVEVQVVPVGPAVVEGTLVPRNEAV